MFRLIPKIINDNFYKWFGKSKVIDSNNEFQICYHRSRSITPFNEFIDGVGEKNDYNNDYGFYFVAEYNKSNISYIGRGIELYVFVKIENPFCIYDDGKGLITDDLGKTYEYLSLSKEFIDSLHILGYDGVIIVRPSQYNQYIVWNGNQIKSIENNGGYSLDNNDIYN